MPDFSAYQRISDQEAKNAKDKADRRIVRIIHKLNFRLTQADMDPMVEAIEILLGIKEGGPEKAAEILGFTGNGETTEVHALGDGETDKKSMWVPAKNATGGQDGAYENTPEGHQLARSHGYVPKLDGDNKLIEWVKSADSPGPAPATGSPDDDVIVNILNLKGKPVGQIKVSEGKAKHDQLIAVKKDDGTVEHFVKKPRVAFGTR
jgi:hypothetical protein